MDLSKREWKVIGAVISMAVIVTVWDHSLRTMLSPWEVMIAGCAVIGLVTTIVVFIFGPNPIRRFPGPVTFFILWALAFLFEYYFLGSSSFIGMNDEGDELVPLFFYLSQHHLGGDFAHHIGGGVDAIASHPLGGQIFNIDEIFLAVFPVWIAILVHKFLVLAVGFIGAYLICNRILECDSRTSTILAALFTVSNHHLIFITFALGAGMAVMPFAAYVIIGRVTNRWYFPVVALTGVLSSGYIAPVLVLAPFGASLIAMAYLLKSFRPKVLVGILLYVCIILLNWSEALAAMLVFSPYAAHTERGALAASAAVAFDDVARGFLRPPRWFLTGFAGIGALGALGLLWVRRDSWRFHATVTVFGFALAFYFLKFFPWASIGLSLVSNLSLWYVLYGLLPVTIVLFARLLRNNDDFGPERQNSANALRLVFAMAIGLLIGFKAYNAISFLYHGGQSAYSAMKPEKGAGYQQSPLRVVTIRARDIGPEPSLAGSFYGMENYDTNHALLPSQYTSFWSLGINRGKPHGPRIWIDWKRWNGETYDFSDRHQLNLLRVANVGLVISPLPLTGPGLSKVSGPEKTPLTLADALKQPLAYVKERFLRLVDFNEPYLYSLAASYPRVYAGRRKIAVDDSLDDVEILKKLGAGIFDGEIVIKSSDSALLGSSTNSLKVVKLEKIRNGIRIDVDAPEGGILIYNTPAIPLWRAHAGEMELPIYEVNLIHQAVRVPPGFREVVFEYDRPGLWQIISEKLAGK